VSDLKHYSRIIAHNLNRNEAKGEITMSKLALTEIQHQKMKKLLDDTYPIGKILMVDTSAIPPELGRGIKRVQDKLEELREAIRNAEDILKETDTF
jgi:hypothetical protein